MIPLLLMHPSPTTRGIRAVEILIKNDIPRNHPDLLWFEAEAKMGVEQARQIKDFLGLKPYQGNKHAVVILSAENLTLDAQNTLLKTLEEPPGETILILGVESEDQLLSTILSRCQILNLAQPDNSQNQISDKYNKDIEKLLSVSMEARFQFIEKLKERDEFLPALTSYFRHRLLESSTTNTTPTHRECRHEFLKDLMEAEKWAKSNVNIRGILEYLMLKMPQDKI